MIEIFLFNQSKHQLSIETMLNDLDIKKVSLNQEKQQLSIEKMKILFSYIGLEVTIRDGVFFRNNNTINILINKIFSFNYNTIFYFIRIL